MGVSTVPLPYATRLTSLSVIKLHHYLYDDHQISRDIYSAFLSTAAYLSHIHSFTMVEYSNTEQTDMVLVYGEAASNRRAARRIYQERYKHCVTPSHTLFAKVIQRVRGRSSFAVNKANLIPYKYFETVRTKVALLTEDTRTKSCTLTHKC